MSEILAKIFGLYFLALGLALIINPHRFKKIYQQIAEDENFLLLSAFLALWIGAFVVSVHNLWFFQWPVIITILGWWGLIKGFAFLIFPDSIKLFSFIQNRANYFYQGIGVIYLILGLFLAYKGWA